MKFKFPKHLKRADDGAVAVEFALIGPALIAALLGVLHIGMGMQSYNALRSVSAEVARTAVVNPLLTLSDIEGIAYRTAEEYGLSQKHFSASVVLATATRVAGTKEYSIRLNYDTPTLLGVIGIESIPLHYERPVFVAE